MYTVAACQASVGGRREVFGDVQQSLLQESDERAIDELRRFLGGRVACPSHADESSARKLNCHAAADGRRDPAVATTPQYDRQLYHGGKMAGEVVEADLPEH